MSCDVALNIGGKFEGAMMAKVIGSFCTRNQTLKNWFQSVKIQRMCVRARQILFPAVRLSDTSNHAWLDQVLQTGSVFRQKKTVSGKL